MGKTIAAIATPPAAGGIAVIRISGGEALAVAGRVFRAKSGEDLGGKKGYTAAFGTLYADGVPLDEGIATVFRAPKSYTGEDIVELSCHGGLFLARKVLQAVLAAGASLAEPGEFTKRAFLNGKLSLTQAEAVADLIAARTGQALDAARAQHGGALNRRIRRIQEELTETASSLAAWADYPEEDLPGVTGGELLCSLRRERDSLRALLETFGAGKLLREGVDTVIAGKPNVGKSTLMNLLAGCDRSIVTEVAGTTRDVVEETVNLNGVLLRLADTAGLHQTEDRVEKLGVERTRARLDTAQLVLAVFDSSQPLTAEDRELFAALHGKPVVAVINKTDLENRAGLDEIEAAFERTVSLSAREETGLDELTEAIRETVSLLEVDASAGILANERQRDCARRALSALEEAVSASEAGVTMDAVTVLLEDALSALLELTGGRVTEEVVNQVFSHFCVGK